MSSKIGKKSKRKGKVTSGLHDHKRMGNFLLPPFANMPKMKLCSWMNDRLPEMLWAALLFTHLERNDAFILFREVGRFVEKHKDKGIWNITHTGISTFPNELQIKLMSLVTSKQRYIDALSPLLLFKNLPSRKNWVNALEVEEPPENIPHLFKAVANTLDHQSETSTDCRWLRVYCQLLSGKYHLPDIELVKGICYFPDYGDLRSVRPHIRASEGGLDLLQEKKTIWPELFWEECLKNTQCITFPGEYENSEKNTTDSVSFEHVGIVYSNVIRLSQDTTKTTGIEPKHDTIFGTALFCLRILIETLVGDAYFSISGRLSLRAIVESYITLSYLVKKDELELWKSHRVYGAGQAKLSMLKVEELEEIPEFIDMQTLTNLANEDVWQEFLSINLSHWDKSNLRQLSEKSDTKDIYDKYYSWSSSYTHGQWGAIRDSVFETCGNPLHRLHRIPSLRIRKLPSVIPDMVCLTNEVLKILSGVYPEFKDKLSCNAT